MPIIGEAAINLVANTKPLMSSLGTVGGIVSRGLMPIAKITAAIGAAIGGVSLGIGGLGVKLAGDMEQAEVAFETMLGSADKAKGLLVDLNKFAASTPFELPGIVDASKKLLAFGSTAGSIPRELKAIGDISAGIGAPIGEIAELYGKARVQGRLMMEDINQLTGRGIPIIGELAKQFGVAESEVRNLVSTGKVGFKNLEQAFADLTGEGGKFFDLMQKQSGTLLGLYSTLKDNVSAVLRDIGNVLIKELNLKPIMASMITSVQGFQQSFIPVFKAVIQITKGFVLTVMDVSKWMYQLVFESQGIFEAVVKVTGAIAGLALGFTALAGTSSGVHAALSIFGKTNMSELMASIKTAIFGIKKFVAALWSMNGAIAALNAIGYGIIVAGILTISTAFLRARANGTEFGDELLKIAETFGLYSDYAGRLQKAQEDLGKAGKDVAAAQKEIDSADSPQKKLEAQRAIITAIENRIDALKKVKKAQDAFNASEGNKTSEMQKKVDGIRLSKMADQLKEAKSALANLEKQAAESPLSGLPDKLKADADKITSIITNLAKELNDFGKSNDDIQALDALRTGGAKAFFTVTNMQDALNTKKGNQELAKLREELDRIGKTGTDLKILDVKNLLFGTDQLKEAKRLIGDIQRKNVDQFIAGKQKQVDLFGKSDAEKEIADLDGATEKQKQKVRSIFGELKRLSVGDYIAKLKIEVDENGLSDIERKLNDLRRQGADATQIAEARALLQQQQDANQPQQRIQTVGLTEMFNRIQTAIGPKDDPQKKTADNTKTVADETKKSNTKLDKLHTVLSSIDKKTATSVVGAGFVQ
jgi:tape measure domain-containing protein